VQHFSLVVEESGLQEALDRLWDKLQVRGEVMARPMDGKFRLDIISERDLTSAQLEKLPGKRPG
jgi:hypothetical protein